MCSIITHNDADGLISSLIYHQHTKTPFKGFYNLSTFYLTGNIKKSDIAVDLDMDNMKSIGHHINPFYNELSENPNNQYLEDFYKQFSCKCPLNTVMILLDKFNIKLTDKRAISLTLFSDGFFVYYKKYTKNCRNWLDRYKMTYLYKALEEDPEIMRIIEEEIIPIFTDNIENYKNLKVKFKDLQIENKEVIKNFCEYVKEAFKLEKGFDYFDVDYVIENKYISKTYEFRTEEEYEQIKTRLKEVNGTETILVSSAMVYRNQINVTMTKNCYIF